MDQFYSIKTNLHGILKSFKNMELKKKLKKVN